jgi:hypothetical protein
MLPLSLRTWLSLTITVFLAASALAQCVDPASPGVVICTPSPGSTVVYDPDLAVRFTPSNGAGIARIVVFDNKQKIEETGAGQDGFDLRDGAMFNGLHHIVVKAWDTAGKMFETSESFHIVGQGFPPCDRPAQPGVNFCDPPRNAVLGRQLALGAAARGVTRITNLSFYLDGVLQQSVDNSYRAAIFVQVPDQGVPHTAKVVATDSRGNRYTATKKVEASYIYSQYACFQTCVPGIDIVAPTDEEYVSVSFSLNMQIRDNPNPITSMTAMLDKTVVATSSGPTLQQEITGAPAGTHILTVTGVDTQGIVYRIQENINIDINK